MDTFVSIKLHLLFMDRLITSYDSRVVEVSYPLNNTLLIFAV